MDRRRRGTGESGTGIVVADGLDDTGYDSAEHADDAGRRDGGHPPLNCGGKTAMKDVLTHL